jgi:hypothetical protein
MNRPVDPVGTPPAPSTSARSARRRWATALVPAALLGGLLALSPFAPARADSGTCYDGNNSEVHLVSGTFGLPLWVSAETYGTSGMSLCYGTAAPGSPMLAGGSVGFITYPSPIPVVSGGIDSDESAAMQAEAVATLQPQYRVRTGSGGQEVTFAIPFSLCTEGVCYPPGHPSEVGTTGVIVGTITQTPTSPGGTSAAYSVTSLCVRVDGTDVLGSCGSRIDDTGVTTTSANPVNINPTTPGPCVLSLCAPNYEYIGTTGNQLATVWVPVLGPVPVYGVHTCLYTKDTYTSCPT